MKNGWMDRRMDRGMALFDLFNKSNNAVLRVAFPVVCVAVLWPSQPIGVMLSTVSLPNNTFTGQA